MYPKSQHPIRCSTTPPDISSARRAIGYNVNLRHFHGETRREKNLGRVGPSVPFYGKQTVLSTWANDCPHEMTTTKRALEDDAAQQGTDELAFWATYHQDSCSISVSDSGIAIGIAVRNGPIPGRKQHAVLISDGSRLLPLRGTPLLTPNV